MGDFISLNEAKEVAEQAGVVVSLPTIRYWVKINKLGHQPSGPTGRWYVHKTKFSNFINGKGSK